MQLKKLLLSIASLAGLTSQAQTVTYSSNIAAIIYAHCTTCHRPGEIAPFTLTSYSDAVSWGSMIQYVTGIGYMPPWKPETTYQHYQKENYLSATEIAQINQWVANGMPEGNASQEPPVPVFPTGSQVGVPDLVVSFAQSYTHVGNNQDEYRYFVLPTHLTQTKDLVALEVRPGNRKIVHHTLVWQDTTGQALAEQNASTTGYGFTGNSSIAGLNGQLPSYVPGQKPMIYTNGIAYHLYAGADLKLQVHYAPEATTQTDSTTVNLFFAQTPATRYLKSNVMVPLPGTLINGPFIIPANKTKTFHGIWTVPEEASMVGIAPHCHKLGQNWTVYAVTPTNDTVNLIKIDQWDFNWQGTYNFKQLIHLPANSVVHAIASYDNTTNNINNPNNPPIQVTWGENTADEMYYLPIIYLSYQTGDENIVFENPTAVNNPKYFQVTDKLYPIAPNPSASNVTIGFTLASGTNVHLGIYNLLGQEVQNLIPSGYYLPGLHSNNFDVSNLAAGNYNVIFETATDRQSQKMVVLR